MTCLRIRRWQFSGCAGGWRAWSDTVVRQSQGPFCLAPAVRSPCSIQRYLTHAVFGCPRPRTALRCAPRLPVQRLPVLFPREPMAGQWSPSVFRLPSLPSSALPLPPYVGPPTPVLAYHFTTIRIRETKAHNQRHALPSELRECESHPPLKSRPSVPESLPFTCARPPHHETASCLRGLHPNNNPPFSLRSQQAQ